MIDKVFSARCLHSSARRVLANKGASGVDHISVEDFASRQMPEIRKLSSSQQDGLYRPQAIRRVDIPKPGLNETRPLRIPTVRDRVVQAAMVKVIEPMFERDFTEQSDGFRPGRNCHDALRRFDQLVQVGYVHVVGADLKGDFDSIPHDRYLDPLDHLMAESGFKMVQNADDVVILCRTTEDAASALELVRQRVTANGLTLHPAKTKVVDVRVEGFGCLDYHFLGPKHWGCETSIRKLKAVIRQKTPSKSVRSLAGIIADVNLSLRG